MMPDVSGHQVCIITKKCAQATGLDPEAASTFTPFYLSGGKELDDSDEVKGTAFADREEGADRAEYSHVLKEIMNRELDRHGKQVVLGPWEGLRGRYACTLVGEIKPSAADIPGMSSTARSQIAAS